MFVSRAQPKFAKNDPEAFQNRPPEAVSIFFPTPKGSQILNPHPTERFRERSAAGVRPWLGKVRPDPKPLWQWHCRWPSLLSIGERGCPWQGRLWPLWPAHARRMKTGLFVFFFLLLSSLLHFLNLFWPKHIHRTNPVTLAMQKCIILFTVSLSLSTLVAQEHGLPVPGWFGLKDSLHHLPICLSIYLYVYLPIYLPIYLFIYLVIYLSIYLLPL